MNETREAVMIKCNPKRNFIIALSVVAADGGVERKHSPDGWTRVHGSSVGAHDPCPLSHVEDDSVDGLAEQPEARADFF
jgi:hypothetical protein